MEKSSKFARTINPKSHTKHVKSRRHFIETLFSLSNRGQTKRALADYRSFLSAFGWYLPASKELITEFCNSMICQDFIYGAVTPLLVQTL